MPRAHQTPGDQKWAEGPWIWIIASFKLLNPGAPYTDVDCHRAWIYGNRGPMASKVGNWLQNVSFHATALHERGCRSTWHTLTTQQCLMIEAFFIPRTHLKSILSSKSNKCGKNGPNIDNKSVSLTHMIKIDITIELKYWQNLKHNKDEIWKN